MPVYVDPLFEWQSGKLWCHMIADTTDELHTMADRLGIARRHAQISSSGVKHYDLYPSKRKQAVDFGAIQITAKELVIKGKQVASETKGGCPFKRDEYHDCRGYDVSRGLNATAVCNFVDDHHHKSCPRYYREAALNDIKPEAFCCRGMENLFHDCAEESGYMAGGFDLRKYPNDGKDVWRNYVRVRFAFCPFCGKQIVDDDHVPVEVNMPGDF